MWVARDKTYFIYTMNMLEDYVTEICRHFLRYFNYHYPVFSTHYWWKPSHYGTDIPINATVIKLGLDIHTPEAMTVVYVLYMCGNGGILVSHTSISKAVLRFWLPFGFRGFHWFRYTTTTNIQTAARFWKSLNIAHRNAEQPTPLITHIPSD